MLYLGKDSPQKEDPVGVYISCDKGSALLESVGLASYSHGHGELEDNLLGRRLD